MGCNESSEQLSPNQPARRIQSKNSLLDRDFLTVATLNYCGIMNSPFEFYTNHLTEQLAKLSEIFVELIPRYAPDYKPGEKFAWRFGKIDVKFRTGRYSSMFELGVGIEEGRFVSEARFEEKWEEVFEAGKGCINVPYTPEEKTCMMKYDLLTFHTLLHYVYQIDKLEEALELDPQSYISTLGPFYELSYLDQEKKLDKVIANFSKVEADVFFFQEYSEHFKTYIEGRREHKIVVDKSKDTMIIAKESSFSKFGDTELVLSRLSPELRESLNWGDRTAFMLADHYLLICAHLTSKAEKNRPQIEQLKKGLIELKTVLPEYEIILGGDLNSYLSPPNEFRSLLHMYPRSEEQLTTIKKRTMVQGQFHKGNKIIEESKDKIITTLPIREGQVLYITGARPAKDNLVPSDEHPFDHFVVAVQVDKADRDL